MMACSIFSLSVFTFLISSSLFWIQTEVATSTRAVGWQHLCRRYMRSTECTSSVDCVWWSRGRGLPLAVCCCPLKLIFWSTSFSECRLHRAPGRPSRRRFICLPSPPRRHAGWHLCYQLMKLRLDYILQEITAAATRGFTMVLFTASHRNDFVGGTCSLPSAILVYVSFSRDVDIGWLCDMCCHSLSGWHLEHDRSIPRGRTELRGLCRWRPVKCTRDATYLCVLCAEQTSAKRCSDRRHWQRTLALQLPCLCIWCVRFSSLSICDTKLVGRQLTVIALIRRTITPLDCWLLMFSICDLLHWL